MRDPQKKQRGAVMIIALGVLFVLSILATTFVTLSRLEMTISSNYLDDVRAKILAQSGVDYALYRMQGLLKDPDPTKRLLGSSQGVKIMTYFGDDATEKSARPDVPLEQATSPSFALETDDDPFAGSPQGVQFVLEGTRVGVSGTVEGGTYGIGGDLYSLKVVDTSSQININDAKNVFLRRVLDNLGQLPQVNVNELGTRIINGRPSDGYTSKYQLLDSVLSEGEFDRVRNFITVHGWVDTNVVNPVPLSPSVAGLYPAELINNRPQVEAGTPVNPTSVDAGSRMYRYGRNPDFHGRPNNTPLEFYTSDASMENATIFGWDEINPQYIEVSERTPVNLNTASREVLLALVTGLEGFFVMEDPSPLMEGYAWLGMRDEHRGSGFNSGSIGTIYRTASIEGASGGTTTGSSISADRIVDALVTRRESRPFQNWSDFNTFIDSMVGPGKVFWDERPELNARPVSIPEFGFTWTPPTWVTTFKRMVASQAAADVLKANFNPNLHLNEINPNNSMYTLVDKTDLINGSTEFCFSPTGVFEITSLGRVVIPDGTDNVFSALDNRLIAAKKLQVVVKLYEPLRRSSQRHFYGGDMMLAGDPTVNPDVSQFVAYRTNNNLPLETGPEPDNGRAPLENEYEGYIQLSSIGGVLPVGNLSASPVAGVTHKPKGQLWETPRGGEGHDERAHGHFTFDADLHYASAARLTANDNKRRALTRNWNRGQKVDYQTFYNWPDWSEQASGAPLSGPYSASDDPSVTPFAAVNPDSKFRIARSYRVDDSSSGGTSASSMTGRFNAPMDLRVDGLYVERGSAAIYWPGSAAVPESNGSSNMNVKEGVIAYWIKPGFQPAIASKVRKWFSNARFHQLSRIPDQVAYITADGSAILHYNYEGARPDVMDYVNPSPFSHYYLPQYPAEEGTNPGDTSAPSYAIGSDGSVISVINLPPHSMGFGYGFSFVTGYGKYSTVQMQASVNGQGPFTWIYEPHNQIEGGVVTNSLNHTFHGDSNYDNNVFDAHRWIHVGIRWDMSATTFENQAEMYINGEPHQTINGSVRRHHYPYFTPYRPPLIDTPERYWFLDDFNNVDSTRAAASFGVPSDPAGGPTWYEMTQPDPAYANNFRYFPSLGLNPMRIGEPSVLNPAAFSASPDDTVHAKYYERNFAPDSTVDEFYIWGDVGAGEVESRKIWETGRYYRNNDGMYRSAAIDLSDLRMTRRVVATDTSTPTAPVADSLYLLAVSWTQYAEMYESSRPTGEQFRLRDHSSKPNGDLNGSIEVVVSVDGGTTWSGLNGATAPQMEGVAGLNDSAWSPTTDGAGSALQIPAGSDLLYGLRFKTDADPLNTILIDTPIFDDITFYLMSRHPQFLETLVLG